MCEQPTADAEGEVGKFSFFLSFPSAELGMGLFGHKKEEDDEDITILPKCREKGLAQILNLDLLLNHQYPALSVNQQPMSSKKPFEEQFEPCISSQEQRDLLNWVAQL